MQFEALFPRGRAVPMRHTTLWRIVEVYFCITINLESFHVSIPVSKWTTVVLNEKIKKYWWLLWHRHVVKQSMPCIQHTRWQLSPRRNPQPLSSWVEREEGGKTQSWCDPGFASHTAAQTASKLSSDWPTWSIFEAYAGRFSVVNLACSILTC